MLIFIGWSPLIAGPLDLSGNLGVTYRSLDGTSGNDETATQYRGTLNARSYLWAPWLATVDAGVTVTAEDADQDKGVSNETEIWTGDLNLNVLPQSRTPVQLSYRTSDSRVDWLNIASPLTSFGREEYKTDRLSARGSYLTKGGSRYQVRYDTDTWDSKGGEKYESDLIGAEMNLRLPMQTINAKASKQESDHSRANKKTENTTVNLDHFYHPSKELRFDSLVSYYQNDSSSDMVSGGRHSYETTSLQASSFAFWRPEGRPMTVSGGVRVYDLESQSTDTNVSNNPFSINASAGMLYQFTKNLRLDGSADLSVIDDNTGSATVHRERAGALYQSDLQDIFSGAIYQWYTSGAVQNQDAETQNLQNLMVTLGHNLQKTWTKDNRPSWRLSLDQSGNENKQFGDNSMSILRVDHAVNLSWSSLAENGNTYAQASLTDSRNIGDQKGDQQVYNVQATRQQTINRRSSLSGNLTLQTVKRDFEGQNSDSVTTMTGQVNYNHSRIFGVLRLRFASNLRMSEASESAGYDRAEWENRLDYSVGLLDTSLSWRQIVSGDADYNLLYAQITRRF